MALINKLTAIADSIREKTGKTNMLTLDQMPLEIAGIQTGVELNFKIVGGTARPVSPAENTVWINTDAEITGYVLSATEPENPTGGMVWVTIGNYGDIKATSPIDDEWIVIYPRFIRQYINGSWVDKEAKSYQNGAWVDWWYGQLYENGDQFVDITGGWGVHDYITNSRNLMAAEHQSDKMFFQAQNNYRVFMGIGNPIDLSDKKQIRFVGKVNQNFIYNNWFYGLHIEILKTKDQDSKVAELQWVTIENFDSVLDVSELSGEHYVTIWADSDANINGYVTGVYIS